MIAIGVFVGGLKAFSLLIGGLVGWRVVPLIVVTYAMAKLDSLLMEVVGVASW
jgi:hypothetical protein